MDALENSPGPCPRRPRMRTSLPAALYQCRRNIGPCVMTMSPLESRTAEDGRTSSSESSSVLPMVTTGVVLMVQTGGACSSVAVAAPTTAAAPEGAS